tara:strand:- start:1156 stop:1839 length:684 start_codon:yes stop_codon:yes gene_type:complete
MSTYAFDLDLGDVVEEAFERAGSELKSGYDYRTARRSMNLMFLDWQNRGLNLWTIKNGTQALTAGTSKYDLDAKVLDIVEASIRTNVGDVSRQTDQSVTRISVKQYSHLTNKLTQSKPLQFWLEKSDTVSSVNLWPVPDSTQTYVLDFYYIERIADIGSSGSDNPEVPSRFLPCLVAGLAYNIALKKPELAQRIPLLKSLYEEEWTNATDADRGKESLFFVPGGYRY